MTKKQIVSEVLQIVGFILLLIVAAILMMAM